MDAEPTFGQRDALRDGSPWWVAASSPRRAVQAGLRLSKLNVYQIPILLGRLVVRVSPAGASAKRTARPSGRGICLTMPQQVPEMMMPKTNAASLAQTILNERFRVWAFAAPNLLYPKWV
jgi:hypothetical protein